MRGESFEITREAIPTIKDDDIKEVDFKSLFINEEYEAFFVEYRGDIKERLSKIDYARIYFTGTFFAIIFVKAGMVNTLIQNVPEIINIQKNFPYTLARIKIEDGVFSSKEINKGSVPYNGEGVIVGIISSGIDYLNPRFMKEDGTTRIISIWDQSINTEKTYENVIYGTEFKREDIDEAIKLNILGKNPYEKVSHRDETGDGTAIAGVIGGRKLSASDPFNSIAPNCEFVAVKLKEARKSTLEINGIIDPTEQVFGGTDIASALSYLSWLQLRLKKPMVVYLGLGSSLGGHDGGTVLEAYIDFITEKRGFAVVASVGTQGAAATHASGNLLETGSKDIIAFNVDPEEKSVIISLFTIEPDRVSIGLITPEGISKEKVEIPERNGESVFFTLGSSNVNVQHYVEAKVLPDTRLDIIIRDVTPGVNVIKL